MPVLTGAIGSLVGTTSDGALVSIDSAHRHIHAGTSYTSSGQATLNAAATRIFLLQVGADDVHLFYRVRASGEGSAKLYEGPTFSNAGTGVTPVNRKRSATRATTLTLTHTPTTSDNGTLLEEQHFGNGPNAGGEVRGDSEWELAEDRDYLLVITSEAASNDISWLLDWYEE